MTTMQRLYSRQTARQKTGNEDARMTHLFTSVLQEKCKHIPQH
jgi:hypothetical protein